MPRILAASLISALFASALTALFLRGTPEAHAVATAQEDSVKARQFVLLDSKGKAKAVWSTGKDDQLPCLAFMDNEGKVRISLALTLDGTGGLSIMDRQENSRIGMAVGKDGEPVITVTNRAGKVVAGVVVQEDQGVLLLNGERKQ